MTPGALFASFALLAPFGALGAAVEAQHPPQFLPAARSVSNWRAEASGHLDLAPERAQALAEGGDERGMTRCVRLNNYWCVKGLGWSGMIGADAEGHAAFASALEGAAVTALLLRRYYRDYSRRSARTIVSRWAPAQCGVARLLGGSSTIPTPPAKPGVKGLPGIAAPDGLSTRGIGQTLRARWMARGHGRVAKAARAAPRSQAAADLPPLMRAPSIALAPEKMGQRNLGLGETPVAMPELKLAALTMPGPEPLRPMVNCASEMVRIEAYAQKARAGVAASPEEDLALFTPEGEPTANLARVMENMSTVEIGPLRADKAVIAAGIERAMEALRPTRAGLDQASR